MSPNPPTPPSSPGSDAPAPAAVLWRLTGRVQGVGFRPTAYRLATALALRGWVRNDPAGAELLLVGSPAAIRG
ncbi:MAG: acylphosphatase, partial [Kiritimatiellae bacterium]|nr:acylphosphatase [Kiritimatiellia bacterium]